MLPLSPVNEAENRARLTPRALARLGALGLFVPLAYPLMTGRVFTRDDLAALHLPLRYLYREGLQAGHLTLWTPAYHAGYFLHGAGEVGMMHPLHLALYSWLPLGVAFNLEIISSYLFLFAGAYLLWRALDLSIEGAIVGAMLAAFSGFTVYNLMHVNHIATLAHSPWLLLACHGVIAGKRPAASFALAALVTGSQLLTGNPQYVWITFVVTLCFCAMAMVASGRRTRDRGAGDRGAARRADRIDPVTAVDRVLRRFGASDLDTRASADILALAAESRPTLDAVCVPLPCLRARRRRHRS